jgi:hypothetical protein
LLAQAIGWSFVSIEEAERRRGFEPQMTQMGADVFLKFFVCLNLRNLRLNKVSAPEPDKALKEIREKMRQ